MDKAQSAEIDKLSFLMDQGMTTEEIREYEKQDIPIETLFEAVYSMTERGEDWRSGLPKVEPHKITLKSFSEVAYEPPRFLIPPYFPSGKITIVQGDSGVGKTAFMCAIAAHVSRGKPILETRCDKGNVLIISVEDDASTLRGRIEASGGDLHSCYFIDEAATAGITFTSPEIEEAIQQIHAKMVILDPLQCFLGKADMNKANETRPMLAALAEMAKRNDCAVVIISHMAKGQQKAIYKALGSVDIVAASRSVVFIGRNPDDTNTCAAVHLKCSNAEKGKTITYEIGKRGGIAWTGYSDLTEEDLERAKTRKKYGIDYDSDPIVAVLRAIIADNPNGTFLTYDALQSFGETILGYPLTSNNNELRTKVDCLRVDLIRKDRIRVETIKSRPKEYVRRGKTIQPENTNPARGLRIERYEIQKEFQTSIGL